MTDNSCNGTGRLRTPDDFWNPTDPTDFFDDERHLQVTSIHVCNTGTIDMSAVAAWKQGVEIRQQSDYDAGAVKLFSGEPGHAFRKEFSIGQDRVDDAIEINQYVEQSTYTYAPETLIDPQRKRYDLKNVDGNGSLFGVIEPFTKHRRLVTALDGDGIKLRETNRTPSALMSGNESSVENSDQLLSVDEYDLLHHSVAYNDTLRSPALAVNPSSITNNVAPFSEYVQQDILIGSDMQLAMLKMSGSTETYVSIKQRSGACGNTFDGNTNIGTDSVAFGGQKY